MPPPKRKTPQRTVGIGDELWDAFGEAIEKAGFDDRATVIRQFVRWYVGQSPLPPKPE